MHFIKTRFSIIAVLVLMSLCVLFYQHTHPRLPSGYIRLDQIERLKINQSPQQVFDLLGEPFEDLGSGVYHLVYKIENDKYDTLHLTFLNYLTNACLVDYDGETTAISMDTLPEDEVEDIKIYVDDIIQVE